MPNQLRFKQFRVKSFDAETGTLEGYGSKFNVIDQVGDVVMPGAFKNSLMGGAQNIKFLWQHNPAEPIGVFTEMKEDDNGLYFKAQLADTQRGREARTLMKMGAIDGFSIGYIPLIEERSDEFAKNRSVNLVKEVKLMEVSLVTFPCNTQARLESIKSEFDERFSTLSLDDQEIVRSFIDAMIESKTLIIRNPLEEQNEEEEGKPAPAPAPEPDSDEDESDADDQDEEIVEEEEQEDDADEQSDDLDALKSLRNQLAAKQLRDALKRK